ncbi:MAG: phospho-N-acetylmuramoyl-pentapeptide-transferase [Phycisphaerae bacterium]|nr:phospho-N-acetylmuramoyl-pentapeptide-transferase [Phycisphaerae bacterium]
MLYHFFRILLEGRHYAYENTLFRATCAALFCFLLILLIGPKVIRALVKYKLGDHPEFDHESLNKLMRDKERIPTMGGVMIIGSIILSILLFADFLVFYVQMSILCILWLGTVGAVDDWFKLTSAGRSGTRDGLKSYEKLLFQVGLAVIVGYFVYSTGRTNFAWVGGEAGAEQIEAYRILSVPFYKHGLLLAPLPFMLVAVLVITGTSNAVNLTDGMDGLASGCVAICSLVFMILAYIVGDEALSRKLLLPHIPQSGELAIICGSIVGACAGFLWYNCYPARVFMGDTGSLPLGGAIGYVAVVIRQELMLFIVGGVFVIEAVSVILQVWYFKSTGGKRMFRCAPLHHHYHLSGWTETQTVVRFWLVAAMFAVFALATVKLR